jgi:hypothetical protein
MRPTRTCVLRRLQIRPRPEHATQRDGPNRSLDYFFEVEQVVNMKFVALSAALVMACVCAEAAQAAPSRSEFIRKGDEACAQTKRELVPLVARAQQAKVLPQSEQWAAAAALWADQIRIQKRFVVRFKAIGTPAGDTVAQKLVASLASGVTLAIRVQRGFAERNQVLLSTALPAYLRFTLALNKRVAAYGFRTCGR